MAEPSIKGSAIQSAVEDVNRLVDEGRISRDELEARLSAQDLKVLDHKILPGLWYPLDSYGRLLDLLVERDGRGQGDYLQARGRKAGERLVQAGLYSQLEASQERWGARIGNVFATLGPAMFSATEWSFASAESVDSFEIEAAIPAEFPESARLTALGFIEFLAERTAGHPVRVLSERPSPDRMTFATPRAA